jgi:hypothetical protein
LGATNRTRNEARVQARDVSNSAIAVGDGASAKVLNKRVELSQESVRELTQLMDALIAQIRRAENQELIDDAQAIRAELQRKRVNLGLIRPALKGLAASLGTVQSAADIASNVLGLIKHLG